MDYGGLLKGFNHLILNNNGPLIHESNIKNTFDSITQELGTENLINSLLKKESINNKEEVIEGYSV